jgi:hypothetical protein
LVGAVGALKDAGRLDEHYPQIRYLELTGVHCLRVTQ